MPFPAWGRPSQPRACRQRRRSESLPLRAGFRSLDRARALAKFERRPEEARQYHQGWRPVYPIPVLRRRARRHTVRETARRQASSLADISDGPAADEGRCDRARQQARQDGLGPDGQGRELQGASRAREIACCSGKEIARAMAVRTVGKGRQHVMQDWSTRRSGHPTWATALSNACY